MRHFISAFVCLMILGGCYVPASQYMKRTLGDRVYVESEIGLRDPENTVLIKDALNRAVVNRFHGKLRRREEADTIIYVKLDDLNFDAFSYDRFGFVSAYRAKVKLNFQYSGPKGKAHFTGEGKFDFPIEADAVISDTRRFEAIENASQNAIDSFISYLGMRGYHD